MILSVRWLSFLKMSFCGRSLEHSPSTVGRSVVSAAGGSGIESSRRQFLLRTIAYCNCCKENWARERLIQKNYTIVNYDF